MAACIHEMEKTRIFVATEQMYLSPRWSTYVQPQFQIGLGWISLANYK